MRQKSDNSAGNNAEVKPEDPRRSLAPRILEPGEDAYKFVEELDHAISLPQCRNIALTGVYGSGKSSIIDTYLKWDSAPKNVLRLSLSNLDDKGTSGDAKSYENVIEFKLFQHIIFEANYEKTHRSRYKRLHVTDAKSVNRTAVEIIIFVLCFVIVFEPKIFQVDSFYRGYRFITGSWANNVNIVFDILACLGMIFLLYRLIRFIIIKCSGLSVGRIKARVFDVKFRDNKSVFNKLLDEIIYYFEAGAYELVVFEDLDRISSPGILFLKLREINLLLNESDYYLSRGKSIKFLYAIRDDVFLNDIRTKCFDYIIPVIPVVNSFNVGEYMQKHYSKELEDIENWTDIKHLGSFISTLRDLINIMNEFILYKKVISKNDNVSAKKLLALTIFKNLYPDDYSAIHSKESYLYLVFENKHVFSDSLKEEKENLINTIDDSRKSVAKERLSILNWLKDKGISDLVVNGDAFSLAEVAETDGLFSSFQNDRIDSCVINAQQSEYTYKFDVIVKEVDTDMKIRNAITDAERKIAGYLEKRKSLERRIFKINSRTLCDLLKRTGSEDTSKELLGKAINKENLNESIVSVLYDMIASGYISEDYRDYISYNYIDENDFMFQQTVILNKDPLRYEYQLNKIDVFIDNLHLEHYRNKSILNYCLLDYLLESKNEYSRCLDYFISTARANLDFVVSYDSTHSPNDKFMNHLFQGWEGCVSSISGIQDNDIRTHMLQLLFRYAPEGMAITTAESEFIGTQYAFIAADFRNCDSDRLINFLKRNKVKFNQLSQPDEASRLFFETTVAHNQYAVNYQNLKLIYGEDFEKKSLTTIIRHKDDSVERYNYVTGNIENLFAHFPGTDTEEEEDALIMLANSKLKDDDIILFFIKQKNKIEDLTDIKPERYSALAEADAFEPTWKNVRLSFRHIPDQVVVNYVAKHAQELAASGKMEDAALQDLLLNNNDTLTIDQYDAVASSASMIDVSKIGELESERFHILMKKDGLIEYNSQTTDLLSRLAPNIFAGYIAYNFEKFISDEQAKGYVTIACGIELMKSLLLDSAQKARFLSKFGSIILGAPENKETQNQTELARLICEFYRDYLSGSEKDSIEEDLILMALKAYNGDGALTTKQELIYKVLNCLQYDKKRTQKMMSSLGEPYNRVNPYATDDIILPYKDEKDKKTVTELLNYLKENSGFISDLDIGNDKITVRFNNRLKM